MRKIFGTLALVSALASGINCSSPAFAQALDLTEVAETELFYQYPLQTFDHAFLYRPDYDSGTQIEVRSKLVNDQQATVIEVNGSNSKGYHWTILFNLKDGSISREEGQLGNHSSKVLAAPAIAPATKDEYLNLLNEIKSQVMQVYEGRFVALNKPVPELGSVLTYLDKVIAEVK